jgi:hypothetical protein
MANTLLIESSKYLVFVRVLGGQADGPLITVDSRGHIHIGPSDPGPLGERLQAAVREIEAGVGRFQQVATEIPARV